MFLLSMIQYDQHYSSTYEAIISLSRVQYSRDKGGILSEGFFVCSPQLINVKKTPLATGESLSTSVKGYQSAGSL